MKTDENRNEDEESGGNKKSAVSRLDSTNKYASRRYDSDLESSDNFSNYGQRQKITEEPPIDPKNWFDVIISCGFGSFEYSLGPRFSRPSFRAKFARKVFCVVTLQNFFVLLWMLLFLTRETFPTFAKEHPGVLVLTFMLYGLIYCGIRFARCGGEGLCLMGNILILLFMTSLLAYISANIAMIFPPWPLIICALWGTVLLITVASFCQSTNILGNLIYCVALCSGLLNGCSMVAASYFYFEHGPKIMDASFLRYFLPITILPPILGLWIVHEVKKLIGGRRTKLNDDQWLIAAVIL